MTHPHRAAQADDPAALPQAGRQSGLNVPVPARLDSTEAIRQIAGGLAALAGKVDRLSEVVAAGLRPLVTLADRKEALSTAREIITELGMPPSAERVHAELAVARYLTGE